MSNYPPAHLCSLHNISSSFTVPELLDVRRNSGNFQARTISINITYRSKELPFERLALGALIIRPGLPISFVQLLNLLSMFITLFASNG